MTDAIQVGAPRVTINRNDHVLATRPDGSIEPGSDGGFYARDTRFVSGYSVTLGGQPLQLLNSSSIRFYSAQHVLVNTAMEDASGPIRPGTIAVTLDRTVSDGIHEDYDLVSYERRPVELELAIAVTADFADMFDVRNVARDREHGTTRIRWDDERKELRAVYRHGDFRRELLLTTDRAYSAPEWRDGQIVFSVRIEPKGFWHTCIRWLPILRPGIEPQTLECHALSGAVPRADLAAASEVDITTSNAVVQRAWERAVRDMESLRLVARHHGRTQVAAAGTPWFLTLFGRDSIITALQAISGYPELARGTLARLGASQATRDDPERDMEPGKILHEIRYGEIAQLGILPFQPYYGTHDATSLYVVLLSATYDWTADRTILDRHLPNAAAAMRWIDTWGDRDGDGFQEYKTRSSRGFYNQGWKDAWDGIPAEDGTVATLPIALCELQGYAYDAKIRLAQICTAVGRHEEAEQLRTEAHRLYERFNETFWWEEEGTYYLGLDGDKRPIRSVASNAGHCLLSGIVPADRAERVARRLLADDMCSGWGIRTLSSDHPAYNPFSYHTGSVWPHDNVTIAGGFARYGLRREAAQVAKGLFDAADAFAANHLPELFAGLHRFPQSFPVQYLGANVPQAWATSAIFRLVVIMCGIRARTDEDGHSQLYVDPALPDWLPELTMRRIRAGTGEIELRFQYGGVQVLSNTSRFEVLKAAPPPRNALVPERVGA